MGNFYRTISLSIMEQDGKIRRSFPQFKKLGSYNKGIWIGNLKPTEWSPEYKIRIVYDLKTSPKVTVLEPELVLAKGRTQLPHVYPGNQLCLFESQKKGVGS